MHAEFVLDLNDWVRKVLVGESTRAQLHRLLRLRVYVKLRSYDIVKESVIVRVPYFDNKKEPCLC